MKEKAIPAVCNEAKAPGLDAHLLMMFEHVVALGRDD
jgi:hypothetical protein